MKKIIIFLSAIACIFSVNTFALFCPKNFNQINPGDSVEKVLQLCGIPDAKKTFPSEANVPQEWNYYAKPNPPDQGTLKMTIAFVNNQAVNITVNGTSLTATPLCNNTMQNGFTQNQSNNTIQTGNTQEQIEAACGKPAFINKGNMPTGSPAANPIQITELTYNGTPPIILVFENGILKNKK